jgi:uncharacterized protein (TIGR04255 family)
MATPRKHLPNAPIVEAVIDFRVSPQEQSKSDTFAGLSESIGARYTQNSLLQSIGARFGIENGQLVNAVDMPTTVGWRYQSENEIAQFRFNGFTFSKIAPYTTWDKVFGEACRLWGVYVEACDPKQVSRVAVRYINRMRLDAPADLHQYLESPPSLPAPMPQTIREFLSRVQVEDRNRGASAVIVQVLEPQVDSSVMSVLLDIDAFRDVNMTPNDPTMLSIFQQLRELKNEIFFASITEKTAEMYE